MSCNLSQELPSTLIPSPTTLLLRTILLLKSTALTIFTTLIRLHQASTSKIPMLNSEEMLSLAHKEMVSTTICKEIRVQLALRDKLWVLSKTMKLMPLAMMPLPSGATMHPDKMPAADLVTATWLSLPLSVVSLLGRLVMMPLEPTNLEVLSFMDSIFWILRVVVLRLNKLMNPLMMSLLSKILSLLVFPSLVTLMTTTTSTVSRLSTQMTKLLMELNSDLSVVANSPSLLIAPSFSLSPEIFHSTL